MTYGLSKRTLGASLDEQRTVADKVLGNIGELLDSVGHDDGIDRYNGINKSKRAKGVLFRRNEQKKRSIEGRNSQRRG